MDHATHLAQHTEGAAAAGLAVEIPSPSAAIRAINEVLCASPVDLKRLGELVEGCPQLTGRVLQLCRACLLDGSEPVSRFEHAVILAGAGNARTLLLAAAMEDYAAARLPSTVVRDFWRHSVAVARLSACLAIWGGDAQVEEAWLAGLLHDVGALPLLAATGREPRPSPAPREWITGAPTTQPRRFAADHCELGRRMGVEWNIPQPVVETLARHHDPLDPATLALTRFVAIAEMVSELWAGGVDSGAAPSVSSLRRLIRLPALAPVGVDPTRAAQRWHPGGSADRGFDEAGMENFPGLSTEAALHLVQIVQPEIAGPARTLAPETNPTCAPRI